MAPAQVLEYEGFNYTGTALHGQAGGTGWGAGSWTNLDGSATLSNDGVSLAYPVTVSHTPAGSRISMTGVGFAERLLGTTMSLTNEGATYYFSALVKYQGAFKFEFWDATVNARWRIGATNDGQSALVGVVAPEVVVPNIFPTNQTVFVIAKMLTHASAADQVFMNVYRAGDVLPAVEPGVWQATTSSASGVALARLRIQNLMPLPLEVDELRVGTTYAAVSGAVAAGPPIVTRQPVSLTNYQGSDAQFIVEATGALPLSFQWRKGASPIPNATNATLLLTNVQAPSAGDYSVTVNNSAGTTNSLTATLTVLLFTNINIGLQGLWHFD